LFDLLVLIESEILFRQICDRTAFIVANDYSNPAQ
jgi:hypothetical protein